jgi:DNA repair protein RecN (Recombination protein N)
VLQNLFIQNYALIDNLNIGFNSGFSTITGETGAGKSILMGALSLIMGQRADSSLLKNKDKKCIVEGSFLIKNYRLQNFFETQDLDYSDTLIIRREISSNGNSRSFINDTPVNLNVLKELGLKLVDIHSQHENLLLANGQFQLSVLDVLAGHSELLNSYKKHYSEYISLQKVLSQLTEKSEKNKNDSDYFQFQLSQLEEAKLQEDELAELEQEKEILSHSGEIMEGLGLAVEILSENESSLIYKIKELKQVLEGVSKNFNQANDWKNRIENIYIELKDIVSDISSSLTKVEANPKRLNVIFERLDSIYKLQQKHKVNTVSELIYIRDDIRNKLLSIELLDEEIKQVNLDLKNQLKILEELASKLSGKRKTTGKHLEKSIVPMLKELGIINASFLVEITKNSEFLSTGKDTVKFLFSANKKVEPMDIAKVASGGELSRLMLAIKSLVTNSNDVHAIIFDEIDSGVSGEIAHKMSEIMQQMSDKLQVISITHLPQIASRGDNHYLVYKDNTGESSATHIRALSQKERITEIAKMLSGKEVTEAALENARNLLNN